MPSQKTKTANQKPDFSIIGTGQLARVLIHALHKAGYSIAEIVSRDLPASRRRARKLGRQVGAKARTFADAALSAAVVWFCIPDDYIPQCAHALAEAKASWRGQVIVHSSGALSSRELAPFSKLAAAVASAHPLMSFVASSPATLAHVPMALEGDAKALRRLRPILRKTGAEVFEIDQESKPAYHAFGSFASPLLIAYLTQMEAMGELAGLSREEARKRAAAILQQTLSNYLQAGPAQAFSGPLRRGDVGTIQKHWQALQKNPSLAQFYRDLVQIALEELPVRNREQIQKTFQA